VISSTNRDLQAAIRDGKFRQDLFYRLNVFHIQMPPLRARREDVPALADGFLREFARELSKGALALTPDAAQALREYSWGRAIVRELRNLMERAGGVERRPRKLTKQQVRSLLPADSEPISAPTSTFERAVSESRAQDDPRGARRDRRQQSRRREPARHRRAHGFGPSLKKHGL